MTGEPNRGLSPVSSVNDLSPASFSINFAQRLVLIPHSDIQVARTLAFQLNSYKP